MNYLCTIIELTRMNSHSNRWDMSDRYEQRVFQWRKDSKESKIIVDIRSSPCIIIHLEEIMGSTLAEIREDWWSVKEENCKRSLLHRSIGKWIKLIKVELEELSNHSPILPVKQKETREREKERSSHPVMSHCINNNRL